MKYYSYENFKNDANSLITKVSSSKPDSIVGIARGGLTLAHAVAEGLNVRDVQTIRTELYDAMNKRKNISIFGECKFSDASNVLVLDDIADSGETLEMVMKDLVSKNPKVNFISATLFYKKSSCFKPDFWINEANDWIDFFWERDFKVN